MVDTTLNDKPLGSELGPKGIVACQTNESFEFDLRSIRSTLADSPHMHNAISSSAAVVLEAPTTAISIDKWYSGQLSSG